ncbi:MAG: YceI family protein [Planctomycetes bacterium]|nr:YceI family protein [Planctomycetota bacterium]
MSKLLQVIGVLAILGFTGAGFGAWMLTKEQVHITVEEGAGDRLSSVDPTAELADRFTALQGDLRGLGQTLGKNFELLDTAAAEREEEAASAREADRAATRAELARLEQSFAGQLARALDSERERHTAALGALQGELAALRAALADRAAAELAAANAAPAEGAPSTPPTEERAPELAQGTPPTSGEASQGAAATPPSGEQAQPAPVEPTPAGEAVDPAAPASKPRKKRSFVAFDLPSDSFTFEGRRSWEIVPSLSRVGFDAKSTLHDFTGATQKVAGSFTADLSAPQVDPQGAIRAEAATLNTGLPDRDTAMYEKLESSKHGAITFTVLGFRSTSSDAKAMKLAGVVRGRLGIRGVEKEIELPVRLAVDDARRLSIEGELVAKMSLWGIEPPSQLGMISVQDEVKIWIALRARATEAKQ